MSADGILGKLRAALGQGRDWLTKDLLGGSRAWDATTLEELESRLLLADVGVEATEWLLDRLRKPSRGDADLAPLATGSSQRSIDNTVAGELPAIVSSSNLDPVV